MSHLAVPLIYQGSTPRFLGVEPTGTHRFRFLPALLKCTTKSVLVVNNALRLLWYLQKRNNQTLHKLNIDWSILKLQKLFSQDKSSVRFSVFCYFININNRQQQVYYAAVTLRHEMDLTHLFFLKTLYTLFIHSLYVLLERTQCGTGTIFGS